MSSTGSSVATRPGSAPASAQQSAALELRAGQKMWTQDQHAALVAMGIPRQATSAELGVFLHQCQRTGLDPFSKQIYLIYRPGFEDGKNVMKPTTQVGIDGFRVIRDRIAKRESLKVEYEDTTWYTADGQACDVWLWDEPPAACKVTVLVDGRRFPAVLRFGEYAQKKKGGELNKMWTEKPAHMIEKCCEADALRKAFPNDMAGVILEDAVPLAEDLPPQQPQRVTGEQLRNRPRPQQVQSEVVDAQVVDDVPPWEPPAPEQPQAPARPAQPAPAGPRDGVIAQFDRLKITAVAERLDYAARLLDIQPIGGLDALTGDEAERLVPMLARCGNRAQLDEMLAAGTVPGGE